MAHSGADRGVLIAYRTYMCRRRYARSTIAGRIATARAWTAAAKDWRRSDYREVEAWVTSRPVSARTQRNLIVELRALYRWALREGLVDVDPCALVDAPRVPALLPRPARDGDIAAVLAGAGPELAAIIAVMACGGLRCVEVASLTWADVDLAAGSVYVLGKGARERRVFLAPEVLRLLVELGGDVGPVFPGHRGGHRSAARVSQLVGRAFRAAGCTTTAHQLRHRAATTALTVPGADLLAVRDFLGHASVATTQGYTALIPGRAAAASRGVGLPAAHAA